MAQVGLAGRARAELRSGLRAGEGRTGGSHNDSDDSTSRDEDDGDQ